MLATSVPMEISPYIFHQSCEQRREHVGETASKSDAETHDTDGNTRNQLPPWLRFSFTNYIKTFFEFVEGVFAACHVATELVYLNYLAQLHPLDRDKFRISVTVASGNNSVT